MNMVSSLIEQVAQLRAEANESTDKAKQDLAVGDLSILNWQRRIIHANAPFHLHSHHRA